VTTLGLLKLSSSAAGAAGLSTTLAEKKEMLAKQKEYLKKRKQKKQERFKKMEQVPYFYSFVFFFILWSNYSRDLELNLCQFFKNCYA
jgi:hypothetical protein